MPSTTEVPGLAAAAAVEAGPPGEVAAELVRILDTHDRDAGQIRHAVAETALRCGDGVYVELLHLLAHLRFTTEQARWHWQAILGLHDRLVAHLGPQVDIRVALVSYFVDVSRQLRNPKVIELQLFQETEESVYRDALTGLFNFRYFREHLEREVQRSCRYGTPLSLVMIDVDDFKAYNDRHGHQAGN